MNASDLIALISLLVAVAALGVAFYAIRRANKTASAATLVSLNETFRAAWVRFFTAGDARRDIELAELLNLFEVACAIYLEGSLSGNSAVLMREYLANVLNLLKQNAYASGHIQSLLQDANTFIFIKRFLRAKRSDLSVTIPPSWYETP